MPRLPHPILLWYVTVLHSGLGVLVLWSSAPLKLTTLTVLHQWGLSRWAIASLFLVSSLLAVYGLRVQSPRTLTRVCWYFFLQQTLLSVGALSSSIMIWRQAVLGILFPLPLVLAAQWPNILLLIAYTWALMLYLYRLYLWHQCALPVEP